jgi:microcin C transport system substrate-binding protein
VHERHRRYDDFAKETLMPRTHARAAIRARTMTSQTLWMMFLTLGAMLVGVAAYAQEGKIIRSHGYSFYGDLKYPADYTHFDYVNPDAPKGGEISISTLGTFDSMNP